MMPEHIAIVVLVIAIAAYFQTVTGFGLGMIVMGVGSLLKLGPLANLATVVSMVTLINAMIALPGKLHHLNWRAMRAAILGVLPATVVGVLLLNLLSRSQSRQLEFLLGIIIIFSGLSLWRRPEPLPRRSSDRSFILSGLLAGLSSGLFGVAGPPVIFHFYRQPMQLMTIRSMLLMVFICTASVRIIEVALLGGLNRQVWYLAGLSALIVPIVTLTGRYLPPPLNPKLMRQFAYLVLVLIGAGLVVPAFTQ